MKTLNLTDVNKSEIKYRIDKFPDGQQQVVIDLNTISFRSYYIKVEKSGGPGYDVKNQPVQIKSRLNNFQDLELIICATKSLRNLGVKEIHLYTPYFLGSRSDRKFEEGSNNYLKDVICPIINSLNFESVIVYDGHSDVLEACLNNFKKVDNFNLVDWVLETLYCYQNETQKYAVLVSPDAGASKKIYKLAEQIGYKGDIITCSKERDTEGKLTKTVVPGHEIKAQDYIIIDDICDGGATFINIAKELQSKWKGLNHNPKIYLIVTHSIFSCGTDELLSYFDGIYTTNSYKEHNNEKIKVLNIF